MAVAVDTDVGRVGSTLGAVQHFVLQQVESAAHRHPAEQLTTVLHLDCKGNNIRFCFCIWLRIKTLRKNVSIIVVENMDNSCTW